MGQMSRLYVYKCVTAMSLTVDCNNTMCHSKEMQVTMALTGDIMLAVG